MSVHAPEAPRGSPVPERRSAVGARPLFDRSIVKRAVVDSFAKLDPRSLLRNPVIFVVEVVSVVVVIRILADIVAGGPVAFDAAIGMGLWFTVLFANFAEAMAEGRGKAQADSLRRTRADLVGRRLTPGGGEETIAASDLRAGRRGHGQGGRADPRRRRHHRGDRLGRRVGHHRGVRAGDPGVGRRPLGGDRGHQGPVGLDQGAGSPPARGSPSSTG